VWRCRNENKERGTLVAADRAGAFLLLWQAVVMLFDIPEFIFPSPWQIAQQFVEFGGPLLEAAWKTFWVTMLGFGHQPSWWACCWAS
jgi:ABC-type nitrate/sulfonate/bicarbonate transport system permease component